MIKALTSVAFAFALFLGLSSTSHAELKTETLTYQVGDQELTGYMVYDDSISGKRPGVLVVHEWWGHDEYARTRADLLARNGYTAFALDMYGTGRLADHPKDAGAMAKEVLSSKGLMQKRFLAALEILKGHESVDATQTAAIGYCFGGNVVLDMARAGVDLEAVVAFHASLTATIPAEPGSVTAKVRVFNGADDPFIKPEDLEYLIESMKIGGADFKYIAYPGVVHSFTSPKATERGEKLNLPLKYDALADADSWIQTLRLFDMTF